MIFVLSLHTSGVTIIDRNIIEDFVRGKTDTYNLITTWITEVVNVRVWTNGLSREDIIADTSMKLLNNFRTGSFQGSSSLKTYVQQITRYTIIDHARAIKRRKTLENASTTLPSFDAHTPLDILEQSEETLIFDRIVSLINAHCRDLWTMIFLDSMNYAEIATRLKISEATVKVRVFRCKEEAIAIKNRLS